MPSECTQKYGEFTAGQIARMVAQYEIFRSPNRGINCGCPESCTATVLATSTTGTNTCQSSIVDNIASYGDEFSACVFTGTTYAQCAACDSSTCAESAPQPTNSPRPTRSPVRPPTAAPVALAPLTALACAKKVKLKCTCRGTTTCKTNAAKSQCRPPLAFSSYKTKVFNTLLTLC